MIPQPARSGVATALRRAYGERVSRPVQSVTTAHQSRSADLSARKRRYLWMMGIRVACLPFVLIVEGWARWLFIIGAVVLPYFAVVVANAVGSPRSGELTPAEPERPALPRGPEHDRELD